MHRFRRLAAMATGTGLLALGGVAAVAGSASAATIGSCGASGDYAACVASLTANHPITITVTVTSSPGQSVYVAWDAVCTQGTGAGSKSGSFTANAPVTRAISHPYNQPDQCIVSADAQLQDGGNSIHVSIASSSTPPPAPAVHQMKGYGGSGSRVVLYTCESASNDIWTHKSNGEYAYKWHNGKWCHDDQGLLW
jgi:hypothetical protein